MNDASHRKQSAEIEWKYAIAASVAATAAAVGLMQLARSIYQIRTLPERVMEWILVFVPLDLFEQGLVAFGSAAKVLALGGAIVFMAAALLAVGAGAMRSGPIAVGVATIGLWLFAMGVVMPVTGAGFFASSLFRDVMLTNLSYASVAFTYGTVLLLARLSLQNRAKAALPEEGRPAYSQGLTLTRHSFIVGLVGMVASYGFTIVFGRQAGAVESSLPLAEISDLELPTPLPIPTEPATATVEAIPPTATQEVAALEPSPTATTPPTEVPSSTSTPSPPPVDPTHSATASPSATPTQVAPTPTNTATAQTRADESRAAGETPTVTEAMDQPSATPVPHTATSTPIPATATSTPVEFRPLRRFRLPRRLSRQHATATRPYRQPLRRSRRHPPRRRHQQ